MLNRVRIVGAAPKLVPQVVRRGERVPIRGRRTLPGLGELVAFIARTHVNVAFGRGPQGRVLIGLTHQARRR